MLTLTLTVLIFTTIVTAARAHPTRQHPGGVIRAPLVHDITGLRKSTARMRRAKCLRAFPVRYRPAYRVPVAKRPAARREWRQRWRVTKRVRSRCLETVLWTWYRTSGAACVKSKEGAWTSHTGNGYYGGFQADLAFQRTYGREYLARYGPANNWPVLAQIHMAYRGWDARGWHPWPNTARQCGLL